MLITDKNELKKYTAENRIWQGIPGIEVTKKGRIFSAFYSGETDEEPGNYVVLVKSDDGVNFTEPIAAVYKENYRCYDECIWIDPLGRLWLIWAIMPDNAVYASICENPDADELVWGEEFFIGNDVMMNKPIVLSTGEWLFPIGVWCDRVWSWMPERRTKQTDLRSFVYVTEDNGKTFKKLGGADVPNRAYDEHMVIELNDDSIMMYVRTMTGIGVSYSYDRGKTWTEGKDSGISGPNSRFHIRRLKSGRILLVNHDDFKGRNNMTALLSEDEGKSWKYKLLLDERNEVSYPDATEDENGNIYITYDRERGCAKRTLEEACADAREILYAKISEEDIIAGKLVNPESKLKCIISRLGEYKGKENNFDDKTRIREFISYFAQGTTDESIERIFNYFYREFRPSMTKEEHQKLDVLIDGLYNAEDKEGHIYSIIKHMWYCERKDETPVFELVRNVIKENNIKDLTNDKIAQMLGISKYYLFYRFKKLTGITVEEYLQAVEKIYKKRTKQREEK